MKLLFSLFFIGIFCSFPAHSEKLKSFQGVVQETKEETEADFIRLKQQEDSKFKHFKLENAHTPLYSASEFLAARKARPMLKKKQDQGQR